MSTGATSTKGRACEGKRRHNAREKAERHLRRLVAAGAALSAMQAYLCRHCDGWHVGHRPHRKREQHD